MKELEKTLKALANGRRLSILKLLKLTHEMNVGPIAKAIHLSIRSTSHHLAILKATNLVQREQRDKEVFYKLTDPLESFVQLVLAHP